MPEDDGLSPLDYEWSHLMKKLKARSPADHRRWRAATAPEPHPIFRIEPGGVASWEVGSKMR